MLVLLLFVVLPVNRGLSDDVLREVHSNEELPKFLRKKYRFENGQLHTEVKLQSVIVALSIKASNTLNFNVVPNGVSCNSSQRLVIWSSNNCGVALVAESNRATIIFYKKDSENDELETGIFNNIKRSEDALMRIGQPVKMQIDCHRSNETARRCPFEVSKLRTDRLLIVLNVGVLSCPQTLIFEKDVYLMVPGSMYDFGNAEKNTKHRYVFGLVACSFVVVASLGLHSNHILNYI